ncbi:MAG: DUF2520 domain-containing protein [Actinomycetota bacterium]|nr:DUF2520 domain-containing protein [Actinomycetota bacterium]
MLLKPGSWLPSLFSDRYLHADRSHVNISIIGPGRAGGALAIAAAQAGHRITSVEGRNSDAVARLRALVPITSGTPDLRIIAVSDDAIAQVAEVLANEHDPAPTVHVSGAMATTLLAPIAAHGVQVGSLHPLQTLPDAQRGAQRLDGAWMAITADEPLRGILHGFAASLGCHPFDLTDDAKPLYHAGAAAVANYTLTTLDLALALFEAAGVPFEAARPLIEATVANAFELGPAGALTGPVARGDTVTVALQLDAIRRQVPQAEALFVDLARSTARLAGTSDAIDGVLA